MVGSVNITNKVYRIIVLIFIISRLRTNFILTPSAHYSPPEGWAFHNNIYSTTFWPTFNTLAITFFILSIVCFSFIVFICILGFLFEISTYYIYLSATTIAFNK